MKFLLAAAFVGTVYAQKIVSVSHDQVIRPPIQIYEDDILIPQMEDKLQKIQIKTDIQSVKNPEIISQVSSDTVLEDNVSVLDEQPQIQIKNDQKIQIKNDQIISIQKQIAIEPIVIPIPKQKQVEYDDVIVINPFPKPVPFNPFNQIDQKNHKNQGFNNQFKDPTKSPHHSTKYNTKDDYDPFVSKPNMDRKQRHEKGRKKNLRKHQKYGNKQGIEEISGFQKYQSEQNYGSRNCKGGRKNKAICLAFLLVGLISTLFGILLSKCLRKCKKNKCKKITYVNKQSSSQQIAIQIAERQRKINELKEQYRNIKSAEDSAAQYKRQQQASNMTYEAQMKKLQERRQQIYVQPNQRYAVIQNQQIPIGRPIKESANSSFACQYPQL